MKSILLATDFSENAENAIEYAIKLFGTEDVRYTLLNTYVEPNTSSNVMVSLSEILRKESLESLDKAVKSLKIDHLGINVISESHYGSLHRIINEMAANVEYDYVVLGTKGVTALENFIMGSNTLSVLKSVKLPLLIIPESSEFKGLHRIAFAADYENIEQIHLLDPMAYIARHTGAEVKIVNVCESEKEMDLTHAVEGFAVHSVLEGIEHQYYSEVNQSVTDGLEVFNNEKDIELLTLVAHKYNFFDRLFHKSVTKQVSRLAELPLLILHE